MSNQKYRTPIPEPKPNPSHAERPDFPPPSEDDTFAITGNEAAGRELENFKRREENEMRVLGSAITLGQEMERHNQRQPKSYNQMENKRGEWVPTIPMPFYGLKKSCSCGKSFWKEKNYVAHYALEHIVLGELPL